MDPSASALEVADQAAPSDTISGLSDFVSSDTKPFLITSMTREEQGVAANDPHGFTLSTYSSRALDLVAASLILALVLPLMILCALAVIATSRGPLIYRHQRIGRNGEMFACLKFRTMVQDADAAIEKMLRVSPETADQWATLHKLKHDPRVTSVGGFLRRYCLDELPQLFNVLSGEMSIVGPRPIVAAEVQRYGLSFPLYCSVKPGLTGLWQVSGRHLLPYPERVRLDATYARSRSLALDLRILWRTVPVVLLGLNE